MPLGTRISLKMLPVIPLLVLLSLFLNTTTAYAKAWGNASFGMYPSGKTVAPNGLIYDPLTRIHLDLNIGSPSFYFFTKNTFLTEKPNPGVTTNKNQGQFDFTKREFDIDLGIAFRPFQDQNIEIRLRTVAFNNLNRGAYTNKPTGFKDGSAVEGRYYLTGETVDGYIIGGYYLGKELVEPDGTPYKPGAFLGTQLNYDISAEAKRLYAFGELTFIRYNGLLETGLAWRPFTRRPNVEVRAIYGRYFNIKKGAVTLDSLLLEMKYYFDGK